MSKRVTVCEHTYVYIYIYICICIYIYICIDIYTVPRMILRLFIKYCKNTVFLSITPTFVYLEKGQHEHS